MTGSALLAIGLNWWQSLIAVTAGSLLATFFVALNGRPGRSRPTDLSAISNRHTRGGQARLVMAVMLAGGIL